MSKVWPAKYVFVPHRNTDDKTHTYSTIPIPKGYCSNIFLRRYHFVFVTHEVESYYVGSSLYIINILYIYMRLFSNTLLLFMEPPQSFHHRYLLTTTSYCEWLELNAKSFDELYKMRHTKRFVTDNLITFLMRNTLFSRTNRYMSTTIPESPVEEASNANNSSFAYYVGIVQLN